MDILNAIYASDEFHIASILVTAIVIIVIDAWLYYWFS